MSKVLICTGIPLLDSKINYSGYTTLFTLAKYVDNQAWKFGRSFFYVLWALSVGGENNKNLYGKFRSDSMEKNKTTIIRSKIFWPLLDLLLIVPAFYLNIVDYFTFFHSTHEKEHIFQFSVFFLNVFEKVCQFFFLNWYLEIDIQFLLNWHNSSARKC